MIFNKNLIDRVKSAEEGENIFFHIETEEHIENLIKELLELGKQNINFTKNIKLEIKNVTEKAIPIKNCLSWTIPSFFSEVIFDKFKLEFSLKGLNYTWKLLFKFVELFDYRIKWSNVGEIEYRYVKSYSLSNEIIFSSSDSKISKLKINQLSSDWENEIILSDGVEEIILDWVMFKGFYSQYNNFKKIEISDSKISNFNLYRDEISILSLKKSLIENVSIIENYWDNLIFSTSIAKKIEIKDTFFESIDIVWLNNISKFYWEEWPWNNDFFSDLPKDYLDNLDSWLEIKFLNFFDKEDEANLDENEVKSKDDKVDLKKMNINLNHINNLNKIKVIWGDNFFNKAKVTLSLNKVRFKNIDNSNYFFWNLNLYSLAFDKCLNFSNFLMFDNIKVWELYINNVNFWKAILNDVEIKNKFFLKSPIFNDTIFNGITFPQSYTLDKSNDLYNQNLSYRQLKDIYRQLKHVMDKNWNHTEADIFHQKEMEYHKYELKEIILKEKLKNTFLSNNVGKEIALTIWKNISNFWNNWIKPLFYLMIISLFWSLIDYWLNNNFSNITWENYLTKSIHYFYPLYWFKKDFIDTLSLKNLFSLVLFKITYWILFWNFIVSLKRINRR